MSLSNWLHCLTVLPSISSQFALLQFKIIHFKYTSFLHLFICNRTDRLPTLIPISFHTCIVSFPQSPWILTYISEVSPSISMTTDGTFCTGVNLSFFDLVAWNTCSGAPSSIPTMGDGMSYLGDKLSLFVLAVWPCR